MPRYGRADKPSTYKENGRITTRPAMAPTVNLPCGSVRNAHPYEIESQRRCVRPVENSLPQARESVIAEPGALVGRWEDLDGLPFCVVHSCSYPYSSKSNPIPALAANWMKSGSRPKPTKGCCPGTRS